MAVKHHMGSGNQTQVLRKSSKCLYVTAELSSFLLLGYQKLLGKKLRYCLAFSLCVLIILAKYFQ